MSVKEPTRAIREELKKLAAIADGATVRRMRDELAKKAVELARRGWQAQTSPDGKPWKKTDEGGTLKKSGRMLASLAVELTPRGFALVDKALSPGGALYAGTQQYGRTIRPKGVERKFKKDEQGRDVYRQVGARQQRIGVGYKRTAGAKPLKWRSADGKWHSAWKIRIPARPIFPKYGRISTAWQREFEAVIESVASKYSR